MKAEQKAGLEAAYRASTYFVDGPDRRFALRVGEASADKDVADLRKHYGDKEVAELVLHVGNAAFFDRVTEASGLRLED